MRQASETWVVVKYFNYHTARPLGITNLLLIENGKGALHNMGSLEISPRL